MFPVSSPPEYVGTPDDYLPPEVLLEQENPVGLACDIWALGCTFFGIRQQIPISDMIYDPDDLIVEIASFFG